MSLLRQRMGGATAVLSFRCQNPATAGFLFQQFWLCA
jgi:hypothetical protein